MLALFNAFDDATKELMRSLATAGIAFTPVVVQYDGELPDEALCPFTTYTGIERNGDPLFFDEVPVPAWCEIRQGREVYGEILRDGDVVGRINYEANSFRQVESVDWLLPDRALGHTDHYDRYGNRYATTYYADGVAYQTVYRGPREWAIEVNHVSRVVTMRSPHGLLTFETLTDFVSYFIDDQRLTDDRVLINSLSHPLFVMRKRASEPNTTLFWQEPMPGDPPGNMATELERPRPWCGSSSSTSGCGRRWRRAIPGPSWT
jgi:accessory Sec system glycosyltransferase GtfB